MKWLTVVVVAFVSSVLFSTSSFAGSDSQAQIIITEVRLGGTGATIVNGGSHKQFISLHNSGDVAVDVSAWRLQYAKSSYAGGCDALAWSTEFLLDGVIDSGSTRLIEFSLTDNAAGSVRIIDQNNVVHDMLGWGNASCFETQPVPTVPQNDKSIVRYIGCDGTYDGADTNNNSLDFIANQTPLSRIIAPECTPVCTADQQLIGGKCADDQCTNIDDFQEDILIGYAAIGRECREILPLNISEVLPNVSGSDTGKEFIELFNPSMINADLRWYRIRINDATIGFPGGAVIPAGSYAVFSDAELGVSLVNTSSSLQILSVNGDVVGDEVTYHTPADDESWASINGVWQYTIYPTFGALNQPSPAKVSEEGSVAEKACAQNQYRNPETGRCRLVSTVAGLAPCKEGQVRSDDTGRCRKEVTTASVKPCKTGQYRSEETNRCRSIVADARLSPCKEGQERNPDTNRCRTIAAAAMDVPGFKTEPVSDTGKAFAGWWVLGGAGVLALGRIGWEWRSEILSAVQKVGAFFTSGK